MSSFNYQNDRLHAEQVSVEALAKRHGTPCYIYSRASIEANDRLFNSLAIRLFKEVNRLISNAKTSYQDVINVIDAVQKAGLSNFNLTTNRP